ncbi:MAG: anti-sigma factor [Bradymonadia bacterium]
MNGLRVLLVVALGALVFACGDDGEENTSAAVIGERTVNVVLSYQGGSNHGPMDASGTAVVNGTTGQVDITVMGLPTLTDDLYEGWLAGGGETPLTTGTFNTDENGEGSSTIVIDNLAARTFTKVVLTVEPAPDPDPAPDARHSIEGPIPAAE